jgi:hypothetical protein
MFNKLDLTRAAPTEVGGIKLGDQRTESYVYGTLFDAPSHGDDEILDLASARAEGVQQQALLSG